MSLLVTNKNGIYCERADVYIDPWRPVKKALITHGHSDHARWGHQSYLCTHSAKPVIQYRLPDAKVESISFGETITINGVQFSFHPAGHIIGSAQIKASYKGESWVVTGDYKVRKDPLAEDFEPVKCQHLITECTFGLPVFKWKDEDFLKNEINDWWNQCQQDEVIPVLGAYSLGKAQRVLSMLDQDIGPIFTHGAVENTNEVLRQQGIQLPATRLVSNELTKKDYKGGMVIAPPSALRSPWMRKFQPYRTAMASGWMALRGNRRRRNVDRGFVISDHADWEGLNFAIRESGAEHIWVTHGYTAIFAQYLKKEKGLDAKVLETGGPPTQKASADEAGDE